MDNKSYMGYQSDSLHVEESYAHDKHKEPQILSLSNKKKFHKFSDEFVF